MRPAGGGEGQRQNEPRLHSRGGGEVHRSAIDIAGVTARLARCGKALARVCAVVERRRLPVLAQTAVVAIWAEGTDATRNARARSVVLVRARLTNCRGEGVQVSNAVRRRRIHTAFRHVHQMGRNHISGKQPCISLCPSSPNGAGDGDGDVAVACMGAEEGWTVRKTLAEEKTAAHQKDTVHSHCRVSLLPG